MTRWGGVRRGALLGAALLAALVLAGCSGDDEDDAPPAAGTTTATEAVAENGAALEVIDPWARATPGEGAGQSTAAYFTLRNTGTAPDRLIGVTAALAGSVELHQTTMVDDVMQMGPVEGVDVPPGESVAFEPGGLHVMLFDLAQALAPNDTVILTLDFESGAQIEVQVVVRALTAEME